MGKNSLEQNRVIKYQWIIRFDEKELVEANKILQALGIRNRNKFVKSLILGTTDRPIKGTKIPAVDINQNRINTKELYDLNRIGNNVNQIAKRINANPDVFFLKEEREMLTELQKTLKQIYLKKEENLGS